MSLPRYPEYKESGLPWAPEVPSHWTISPLKRVAVLKSGSGITSDEIKDDGDFPVYGGNGVRGYTDRFTHDGEFALIGRQGALCGNINYARGRFWASEHAVVVTPVEDAETRWLGELLRSMNLNQYSVSAAQPGLSVEAISNHRIPVPPPAEQHAIATFLDRETTKIDALIAEQEKLLALLAEKRQATISHAVTRGLNPNAPMKDSGIPWLGEVPAHWELRRLKTLSVFTTSGPRGWSEHISEDGSLFVQSGDLNDDLGVDFDSAKRVTVGDDAETARTRLVDGDLVICITGAKTGNVAVCGLVPEPAFVNQHLCLVRPNEDADSRFLGLALKSGIGKTQLDLSQYGLKQGLSLENVRELLIALPPRAEQEVIVSHIDAELHRLLALRKGAEQAIELLKERRSALISAAVTGKIDVRHAA